MALINLIPGMGGQVGNLVVDSISLLEDVASCGPENPFSCFAAVVDLAMVLFDAFQAFFPSRPKVGKDSASDDTALFFIPSANPVIALWGIGIRDLETQGIPTSASGGTGYAAQLKLAQAVLADLKRQFDSPGAPQVNINGVPASGTQIFGWYHLLGFQTNHPDSNAAVIKERILVDNLYTDLVNAGFIDPNTGFPKPPPGPPPPPPKPTCPQGQVWDPVAEKCIPIKPTACPPGFHWDVTVGKCVPDLGIGPQPSDPDNDEFQDCCDETQNALNLLLQAVDSLRSNSADQSCCANVVNAIGLVVQQLAKIAILIQPAPAGAPLDLTPIVNQLAALVAAVSGAGKVDLSGIVTELTRIAGDLAPASVTPAKRPPYSPFVQKLIDQAKALNKDAADQLATVRPDLAQILSS